MQLSHPSVCRFVRGVLLALTVHVSVLHPALSQMKGTPAEQPFLVGYARDLTPKRAMTFFQGVATELSIGESMMKQMEVAETELVSTQVDRPIMGTAWYMVTGLIPSFETVTFQQCADLADARKILSARARQYGGGNTSSANPGATVADLPNDCFTLRNRWVWDNPAPEGEIPDQQALVPTGFERSTEIVEENGQRLLRTTQTMTIYFRYNEGMLYESRFEELTTMNLPATDSLLRAAKGETDLGFEAYLDRIPIGIRTLGWNMINSGAGVQMQPRDDEPEELYGIRQAAGDFALPLIRAVMFDVDNAEGWATFAAAGKPSLHGYATVRTRANGQFSKDLQGLSSGRSLFAPILNDEAALTFHTCAQLPEKFAAVATSGAAWVKYQARDRLPTADPRLVDVDLLAATLDNFAEHRRIEILYKMGWTTESAGVIYGGIQVGDNHELVPSVYRLAVAMDPSVADQFSLESTELGPMAVGRIPEDATAEIERAAGIRPTHLYLLHSNSCLWFALGGEHADEIIRSSAATCSESDTLTRTPLLSFSLDVAKWLEYPQDDPVGVASMLTWLDVNAPWFPPFPFPRGQSGGKRQPLLQKVIDLGGDTDMTVRLLGDESGLVLDARMGEALGTYLIARLIDGQDQMMRRFEEDRKRLMEEQKRLTEKAEQNQKSQDP
ncbi:MAG: hypothetical protein KDA96_04415 [Planctomycetaceae bacterium]|nr:hypothetical protein [Planctomycetaceae bacterium]